MRTKDVASVVAYALDGQGAALLGGNSSSSGRSGLEMSRDPVKLFYLEQALARYHSPGDPASLVDSIRSAITRTFSSLLAVPNSFSWMGNAASSSLLRRTTRSPALRSRARIVASVAFAA